MRWWRVGDQPKYPLLERETGRRENKIQTERWKKSSLEYTKAERVKEKGVRARDGEI